MGLRYAEDNSEIGRAGIQFATPIISIKANDSDCLSRSFLGGDGSIFAFFREREKFRIRTQLIS